MNFKTIVSPGPGCYQQSLKPQAPRYSFGSSTREKNYMSKTLHSPGPGQYNAKRVLGNEGPGYSIKGRRPDVRVLPGKEAPGPGAYEPKSTYTKKEAPKFGIGTTKKNDVPDIYGNTPAPNNYTPKDRQIKTSSSAWG